jgi:phosphate transport system ATP-binding protein
MAAGQVGQDRDGVFLEGLCVEFHGKTVLNDLTLGFPAGEITVVIGRSGSGKTTLLRSLNRLNEFFPGCVTSGTVKISVDDTVVDVYRDCYPPSELRRRVGMVFQTPNVLPVGIAENVAMPLRLVMGLNKREIPEKVENALKSVLLWDEVKDRLRDRASVLSGGQQQRLCLARALALEPDILLLDEPTASLDFRSARNIEDLLLSFKPKYTMIAVSHSLSQARRLADVVVVLKEGCVLKRLSSAEFSERENVEALLNEAF